MAGLAPITDLRFVPKHDDLLAAKLLDHFGPHDGAGDTRRADARFITIASHQQHRFEIERFARLARESLYGDRIPRLDAVLFSTRLDNGVHAFRTPIQTGSQRQAAARRGAQEDAAGTQRRAAETVYNS